MNEAVELALHDDRRVAGSFQEIGGAPDRFRGCPWRRHHFGRRDDVGRIERMNHQAARAAGQRRGELRRQDRRGRAGQDGLRHRRGIEARKDPPLDLDVFGRVLLHVIGPAERLLERGRDAHAGADLTRRRAAEEVVLRKIG